MAKAALRDDLRGPCCAPSSPLTSAGLDSDCVIPEVEVWELPTVTVRHRVFVDYDDDGDPVFAWEPLFSAVAIAWERRVEIDDIAGLTVHHVDLTLPYSGELTIPETITIVTSDGAIYGVSKVEQGTVLVKITAARIEDDEGLGSHFDGGDPTDEGDLVLDGGPP